MGNFQLETFSPEEKKKVAPPPKKKEIPAPDLKAIREEAYAQGVIDGRSAATEEYLNDQGRLTAELIEALYDAGMTNEAARQHVSASMVPIVETIARAIAPVLAEHGLISEIGRLVRQALDSCPKARPRVRCSSELFEPLQRLVNERSLDADVEMAGELLPKEARIIWDQGYDHIDLDACVEEILGCVKLHFHSTTGNEDNE
ncbi:hypothetical protein [Amaricoccus tamworthensis]|uniref:FliH/SctL family protein n=1 Tax=Amaricoccus tamworthensis TaxID=57002 RepID=UPI003C7B83BF